VCAGWRQCYSGWSQELLYTDAGTAHASVGHAGSAAGYHVIFHLQTAASQRRQGNQASRSVSATVIDDVADFEHVYHCNVIVINNYLRQGGNEIIVVLFVCLRTTLLRNFLTDFDEIFRIARQ